MEVTVDNLMQQNPEQLSAWLNHEFRKDDPITTSANWWLSLAQSAALKATSQISSSNAREWANIAIHIYKYLADKIDVSSKNSYECSDMNLRALMIVNSKEMIYDLNINIDAIVEWFFDRLDISLVDAKRNTQDWKDLPLQDIKILRELKNRISPIDFLISNGYLLEEDELINWSRIRKMLP